MAFSPETYALAKKYVNEKLTDGVKITDVALNADYTMTITFSDGQTWTTPKSIRGEQGAMEIIDGKVVADVVRDS